MFVEVTPIAIKRIYYRFYIILAALNCCNAIVLWLFYPESKWRCVGKGREAYANRQSTLAARKSLEEIDFYFAQKYSGQYSSQVDYHMGDVLENKSEVIRTEETKAAEV